MVRPLTLLDRLLRWWRKDDYVSAAAIRNLDQPYGRRTRLREKTLDRSNRDETEEARPTLRSSR